MAFYIRYYDNETLVPKAEDIEPYLSGLNKLPQRELEIIHRRLDKLRSGTNRIYLDAAKKRYLLVIGTAQTNIEEFHKKAKPAAIPNTSNDDKTDFSKDIVETPRNEEGWHFYYLDFSLIENEQETTYCFKAKILNHTLPQAYERMVAYLRQEHGDKLHVPDFKDCNLRVE